MSQSCLVTIPDHLQDIIERFENVVIEKLAPSNLY